MHFVGRTGLFVPVTEEGNGGKLWRVHEEKQYAIAGTKGYNWLEAAVVKGLSEEFLHIDMSYFTRLTEEAIKTVEKFGSFQEFVS